MLLPGGLCIRAVLNVFCSAEGDRFIEQMRWDMFIVLMAHVDAIQLAYRTYRATHKKGDLEISRTIEGSQTSQFLTFQEVEPFLGT